MNGVCETFPAYNRIYIRSNVYLPNGEVDPRTGMLRPDIRRRGRTQAMRAEMNSLNKEYGELDETLAKRAKEKGARMQMRTAVLTVAVFGFVLLMTLLFQQGRLTDAQKRLNRVTGEIESTQKTNDALTLQIAEASDPAAVCYTAVQRLGMVSPENAQAIHLTAVDTRPDMNAVSASADQPAVSASAD